MGLIGRNIGRIDGFFYTMLFAINKKYIVIPIRYQVFAF
jgi:hypothetical protein